MCRYAARIIHQFKSKILDMKSRKKCVITTIVFEANNGRTAIQTAKRIGKKMAVNYKNTDRDRISYTFLGIIDIMQLGDECEVYEVWYDAKSFTNPQRMVAKYKQLISSIS